MKKLLLILPRNERGYWGKVSKNGKAGMVRLSLPTIAALTPSDWEVEILDARATPVEVNHHVDLVGITAFTPETPHAYELADRFRDKGVKVVLGGFHVSALPDEALHHADSVVVGEVEGVWQQLLQDVEHDELQPLYSTDRLIDMTEMVIPRRDLLNRHMYVSGFNTIQATRGCPFNCDYCAVTAFFGHTYRPRPVAEVIEEIRGFTTRDFFFVDDNIIGKPSYAKALFRALTPLKKTWGAQTTIHLARDEELLSLYANSGGKYALIGFESLSEKNLERVKKSWNSPSAYQTAIQRIHKAGINILGSFIFGLDEDDRTVFQRTVEFIMEQQIDAAQFNILTPFPGTKLSRSMKREGRILDRDWAKYTGSEVVFQPKQMSPEELQQGYFWAFRETYTLKNMVKRCLRSPRNFLGRVGLNLGYRKKALRMPGGVNPHPLGEQQ